MSDRTNDPRITVLRRECVRLRRILRDQQRTGVPRYRDRRIEIATAIAGMMIDCGITSVKDKDYIFALNGHNIIFLDTDKHFDFTETKDMSPSKKDAEDGKNVIEKDYFDWNIFV